MSIVVAATSTTRSAGSSREVFLHRPANHSSFCLLASVEKDSATRTNGQATDPSDTSVKGRLETWCSQPGIEPFVTMHAQGYRAFHFTRQRKSSALRRPIRLCVLWARERSGR